MKSINDLIASATMYRAENVVVDPLVGRNPVIALRKKVIINTSLRLSIVMKTIIGSSVLQLLHNYKR